MKKQDFWIEVPGRGRFQVIVDRLSGLCTKGPTVVVEQELDGLEALDTAIHEYLHALHPDWRESRIEKTATEMAKYLWKIGARI